MSGFVQDGLNWAQSAGREHSPMAREQVVGINVRVARQGNWGGSAGRMWD